MGVLCEQNVITVGACIADFIGFLEIGTVLINVIDILSTENYLITKFAVFCVFAIKRILGVLAVCEMISEAVFQVLALKFFEGVSFFKFTPFLV